MTLEQDKNKILPQFNLLLIFIQGRGSDFSVFQDRKRVKYVLQ
jgi:hypothetical protein